MTTYAWGLGKKTNNEAEWLALFYGIYLVKPLGIRKITVIGDSKQVIQRMNSKSNKGMVKTNRIYKRIQQISGQIQASYFHILRSNNVEADKLENKGVKLGIGMSKVNETPPKLFYVP